MSEFQYIGFRAIDGPVSEKNLKFMRQQSSRAEITPWSFDNEYHYGDFHGHTAEMLRRGYDFHFHYANFGIRTLMMRLPNGLPDARAAAPYLEPESLFFKKDKDGKGGIICIDPCFEAGELDELWDLDSFLDRLLPLRSEILDGDLRPLYLAHLAVASDYNHNPEEEKDAPVPAGLNKLTNAQQALAELYGLGEGLLAAAAQDSPALPTHADSHNQYGAWLQSLPETTKVAWLSQLMAEPRSSVRSNILAAFHKGQGSSSWPTRFVERTIAELRSRGEERQREINRQKAEKSARRRAKKLAAMAADPHPTLRKTEQFAKERTREAYDKIGKLLADLREALAGSDRSGLAEQQARKLKDDNPTLNHLTAALRRQGFLKK